MFKFNELKQIHLEITNNCQASCPMCARNVNGGLENPNIVLQSWSIEDFKSIMTPEVLNQLDGYYFCGNFGDPIINNNLIDMCKYSKETAPNCKVIVHTNGSARSTSWWKELAASLPKDHNVLFAIDGLEDTHHLYRIGTNFNTILENAKSFIDAGGKADWVFIKFKHNEHQVEQARKLSKELGFETFTVKNSSRFVITPYVDAVDRNGVVTHKIEPPTETPIKFIDRKTIEAIDEIVEDSVIDCKVKNDKEIYIDAYKNLYPCCHVASIPYLHKTLPGFSMLKDRMVTEHNHMAGLLGEYNTLNKSIKDIIDSEEYQTIWENLWTVDKMLICVRTCGKSKKINYSLPREQWR